MSIQLKSWFTNESLYDTCELDLSKPPKILDELLLEADEIEHEKDTKDMLLLAFVVGVSYWLMIFSNLL